MPQNAFATSNLAGEASSAPPIPVAGSFAAPFPRTFPLSAYGLDFWPVKILVHRSQLKTFGYFWKKIYETE